MNKVGEYPSKFERDIILKLYAAIYFCWHGYFEVDNPEWRARTVKHMGDELQKVLLSIGDYIDNEN